MPPRTIMLLALIGVATNGAASETLCSTAAEVEAAGKAAKPGDVILLRDGTWTDAAINFIAEGRAEQPVTLRAATPGRVVLTGLSRVRFSGRHLVVDGLRFEQCAGPTPFDVVEFRTSTSHEEGVAHECRLTNCSFVDCSPEDKKLNTRFVSLFGTDNRVDHCYLAGKTNLGPTLVVWLHQDPVRHRIDHNHFGPRPPLGFNGGETIRIGDSKTSKVNARCIVESNLFTGCDGEIEIISNKSCETIYRHNTFVDCAGTLTLRHGHRNVVEGNFFFGHHRAMTGGVRIINEDQRVFNNYFAELGGEGAYAALCLMNGIPNGPIDGYDQVQRAVVAFNTVLDCQESIVIGYAFSGRREATAAPRDSAFANNIVVSKRGSLVRTMTAPTALVWTGNLFFGAPIGLQGETGIANNDPKLALGADGLWRPGPGSPAFVAAVGDFPFVSTDIDGQPRPEKKDIGCDQKSSAPIAHRPMTPADVGPAWKAK